MQYQYEKKTIEKQHFIEKDKRNKMATKAPAIIRIMDPLRGAPPRRPAGYNFPFRRNVGRIRNISLPGRPGGRPLHLLRQTAQQIDVYRSVRNRRNQVPTTMSLRGPLGPWQSPGTICRFQLHFDPLNT